MWRKPFFHSAALFHILFNYRGKGNAVIIRWSDFLEWSVFQTFVQNGPEMFLKYWSLYNFPPLYHSILDCSLFRIQWPCPMDSPKSRTYYTKTMLIHCKHNLWNIVMKGLIFRMNRSYFCFKNLSDLGLYFMFWVSYQHIDFITNGIVMHSKCTL